MLTFNKWKDWMNRSVARAHLCTVAAALGFNSWWRVPRDAFRFGGLEYGLVHTLMVAAVAMPVALLQLAVGQLSQQDAVGMWRAVPFFRGVGYLRLLITSLGSVYTTVYLALATKNFFYTISNYDSPELVIAEDDLDIASDDALSSMTFYSRNITVEAVDEPQHYVATALLVAALWIIFPFLLYSPVKSMKRTFYVLGPLVLLLAIVIMSCIGNGTYLSTMVESSDWANFLSPDIWHAALIQALWTVQAAGGYLVSTGDTVYYNCNVEWTTVILTWMNIISSWFCLIFWYSIAGDGEKDQSFLAVIFQVCITAQDQQLSKSWPLLIFAMLFFSGMITMLTLLYPLYDRLRRMGGQKWRVLVAVSSCIGAAASVTVLAGRWTALHILEDVATPLLISITTVLEIFGFVLIYGRKFLAADMEFLTGRKLRKFWVWGWYVAPGIVIVISVWWMTMTILRDPGWMVYPWSASTLVATIVLALILSVTLASVAVIKQVQYDCCEKLRSSFKPSRYWGPRDPITHFYWMSQREDSERGHLGPASYYRRQLGQLSARPSIYQLPEPETPPQKVIDCKYRSNSDDWMYTVYRRQHLENTYSEYSLKGQRPRSKSFDWEFIANLRKKHKKSLEDVEKKSLDEIEKKQVKIVSFAHEAVHRF